MTVLLGIALIASGVCVGWALRGSLDQATIKIVCRTLTTAVGQERVAQAMAEVIAREKAGERPN